MQRNHGKTKVSYCLLLGTFLLQTSARSTSPHALWSSGSGRTSRRSSWNSPGRAPSYKRQKRQSGERRSLLSGEADSSSDDGEGGGEGGGGLMEEDNASLARTDSMSQSQRGPRHRRMESVETRSSMDLPPDALLQVDPLHQLRVWTSDSFLRAWEQSLGINDI